MTPKLSLSHCRLGSSVLRSLFLVAALARCVAGDMTGPDVIGTNIPAVGMSGGEFGFAVMARDWTYDQSWVPDLAGGTLQVGLAITGYTRGNGQLSITDATGASVFSQSLAGNVASGNNTAIQGTPPFHVRIAASGYSGIISLGISPGTTTR